MGFTDDLSEEGCVRSHSATGFGSGSRVRRVSAAKEGKFRQQEGRARHASGCKNWMKGIDKPEEDPARYQVSGIDNCERTGSKPKPGAPVS